MLQISKIKAYSIITKSNLPETDYVINPYVGCMHCCFYCYAQKYPRHSERSEESCNLAGHNGILRHQPQNDNIKWGEFVDVKINAPELIPKKSEKYKGKTILLSSVTDAYQPIERKYKITRRILKELIPLEPNLEILTKSDLVLRDIDLVKEFKNRRVGITITTIDDNLRREIEPLASPTKNRIEALETLKKNEVETYVFVGPILPFLTDWKKIILATRHCVDYYMFENLNVSGELWKHTEHWLKANHPNLLKGHKDVYFSDSKYWGKMEKDIEDFCHKQDIKCEIYFHHKND